MLEEGKINSEEAARLLEALEGKSGGRQETGQETRRQSSQQSFQDEVYKVRQKLDEWRRDFNRKYNETDFERLIDEFSIKAEKLGKNVASTTIGLVDRVIDFIGSFVDTNFFNVFSKYSVVEKSFEAAAVEGMDLSIEAVNGPIQVKRHFENKIVIKSKIRSPQENVDGILRFEDRSGSVTLSINKTGNLSVSHEVYIPDVRLGNVRFVTTNGRIYAEDTASKTITIVTKNGHIELMGLNAELISASTRNGKIQVGYVMGDRIEINTNNSLIDIRHIKAGKISAVTTNGRINVENVQNFGNNDVIDMILKTTNGNIKVNMNDMEDRAYRVRARTTNGSVNLLIPEMTYHQMSRRGKLGQSVEAESGNYAQSPRKVNIDADTFNGYIEIVK